MWWMVAQALARPVTVWELGAAHTLAWHEARDGAMPGGEVSVSLARSLADGPVWTVVGLTAGATSIHDRSRWTPVHEGLLLGQLRPGVGLRVELGRGAIRPLADAQIQLVVAATWGEDAPFRPRTGLGLTAGGGLALRLTERSRLTLRADLAEAGRWSRRLQKDLIAEELYLRHDDVRTVRIGASWGWRLDRRRREPVNRPRA